MCAMCIKDRESEPNPIRIRGVTGRFSSQPYLRPQPLSRLRGGTSTFYLCVLNINLHLIQREATIYGWGWRTLHPTIPGIPGPVVCIFSIDTAGQPPVAVAHVFTVHYGPFRCYWTYSNCVSKYVVSVILSCYPLPPV